MRTRRITRLSSVAGFIVAFAGLVALLASVARGPSGTEPWGTVADTALFVEIAAIAPLMLSFYELGGRTPTRLAQVAQLLGWICVATWSAVQVLEMAGLAGTAWGGVANGPNVAVLLALGYIGLWIAGANLLAGPWLDHTRWAGVIVGLSAALAALGAAPGGIGSEWASAAAWVFLVGTPGWALVRARGFASLSR